MEPFCDFTIWFICKVMSTQKGTKQKSFNYELLSDRSVGVSCEGNSLVAFCYHH